MIKLNGTLAWVWLLGMGLVMEASMTDSKAAETPATRVDFSYAFATPHRITVGRPDSSDRTLLDCQPGSLRMAWTYDDLKSFPLAIFRTPPTLWDVRLTPQVDGRPFAKTRWTRLGGWLPALENVYEDAPGTVRLEVIGGPTAALVRIGLANTGDKPHAFVLRCDSQNWGENPAWLDAARWVGDNLVAGWNDRADRVLILGVGAQSYSQQADKAPPGAKSMVMVWNLGPGEKAAGWLVRPYRGYAAYLDNLRKQDWAKEAEAGRKEWEALLARAAQASIPDPGVSNALKACLADLFIMREPVAEGYVAAVPGTECYRAPNAFEAAIVAVAIDQMGLPKESADGYRMCLDMQEPDGNWNDQKGWGHAMWGGAGFKAWAAMTHFRLTGDKAYLAKVYPHMLASSRWNEGERKRMRVMNGTERPVTYGLMPRGMGDAGLMNDGDLYGIFYPHNIWAVYSDRLAMEAAEILGKKKDAAELRAIFEAARDDLLASIERGVIKEKDYRWIPGVPGKTSGSRWGVLNAAFPCGLLPRDHELITGTLRHIESNLSPGGMPVHTGWMADGMWVAITLDNVAELHLVRGNGDAAAKYLYATLNHGTPLTTWCEERGQEPGTQKTSGDRQHLWTPVAVVREIRDSLVMEDGDGLRLGLGTAREWLASGRPVGIAGAPTHFGAVTYEMRYDAAKSQVVGEVAFAKDCSAAWADVLVRLPGGLKVTAVDRASGATVMPDGAGVRWEKPKGKVKFVAAVQ
jgi:hypothetical protein